MEPRKIYGLTLKQLEEWMRAQGAAAFRARQVFRRLYVQGARDVSDLRELPLKLRKSLAQEFSFAFPAVETVHHSADGSQKYLLRLHDGQGIEAVRMPARNGYTACLSTQVGCAMGCSFCMTARMGLLRNLEPAEIVQQALLLAHDLPPATRLRNLVFMGMGEPLHNLEALLSAVEIFHDPFGFAFSARRMIVSTSGLVSRIHEIARRRSPISLAVSLNGSHDAQRSRLMPVNRRWNLEALLNACREFARQSRRKITMEYILIAGETDALEDAQRVVHLLSNLRCKVNLILYNPVAAQAWQPPSIAHAHAFQRILLEGGLTATLRISKGRDIQAACGQLISAASSPPIPLGQPLSQSADGACGAPWPAGRRIPPGTSGSPESVVQATAGPLAGPGY